MDLGLEGRGCVITGGSRGIGLATGRMLAAAGAEVLLVARGERDLAEAVAECGRAAPAGTEAVAGLQLDVTAADAAEAIGTAVADDLDAAVDVLVNNAGTAHWRDLDAVPEEDWYAAFELNVMAPKRLMDGLVPPMAGRGWGRVVNVSSTSAKRPSANMAEYSVAKAALLSLSRLYADRFAGDGVTVNAVCPGPTKSELWMEGGGLLDQSREAAGLDSREAALEAAGSKRPLGRLAEVDEIAATIAFLCSQPAGYVAGAAWSVDGGTVQVII